MKKKISITIPDDLTPMQEAAEISQRLNQQLLAGNGRQVDHKRIGDQVDIKYLTTEIVIKRVGEKPIEFILCSICGIEYQSDLAKNVFHNYGGRTKKVHVCSETCQQTFISICGNGRAATKKSKLNPIRTY